MMADIMSSDIDIAQDIEFPVTIDVYFHIIDNANGGKSAQVDNSSIDAQIQVLNDDFAHTGLFKFRLAGTTLTVDKRAVMKNKGVDEVRGIQRVIN